MDYKIEHMAVENNNCNGQTAYIYPINKAKGPPAIGEILACGIFFFPRINSTAFLGRRPEVISIYHCFNTISGTATVITAYVLRPVIPFKASTSVLPPLRKL